MVVYTCNPATRETEAGESLEPGRRRLQLVEIIPVHSSMGDKKKKSWRLKKKNNNKAKKHYLICYNL